MEQLIESLLRHLPEWLEKDLPEWLPGVAKVLFFQFLQHFLVASRPNIFLKYLMAIGLTFFLIKVFVSVHSVINWVWRRRAQVFISFQHDLESIADALAAEMAKSGIDQVKLPFEEKPDHDRLLDRVRDAIQSCHVFLCVPGSRPSFVESEVSMAFGQNKPLLFVVKVEADRPRLPNTAKKGYPVFALERVQGEGLRTLVNFCSYLAADLRSTVRLYETVYLHSGTVLKHWKGWIALLGLYIVSIVLAMDVLRIPLVNSGWTLDAPSLSFIATGTVLFLVVYGVFVYKRWVFRAKLKRVISGKKFSESSLPEMLDYSLTRENLLKILYCGEIHAEHESDTPAAQNT